MAGIDTIEHAEAAYDLSTGETIADGDPSTPSPDGAAAEPADTEPALHG